MAATDSGHRSSRGQVIIFGTLLMIGVFGLTSAAMDVGYLAMQNQNTQSILDAAALSALHQAYNNGADAEEVAFSVLQDNITGDTDNDDHVDDDWNLVCGPWWDFDLDVVEENLPDEMEGYDLAITYPYADKTTELYATLTFPKKFLFNKYMESDTAVFSLHSHAKLSTDKSDWPYFQSDSTHSGQNTVATFVPPLSLAWEFTAAGSTRSQATIKNSVVYFTAGTYLYALNAEDGKEKWKYNIGLADGCVPIVTGDFIYVGSNYGSDTTYCFNAAGGKVWSTTMKNIGTTTALAVDDKYVYQQSTSDGRLYVYSKDTGQPIKPLLSLPVDPAISRSNTGLVGAGGTGGFSAPVVYNNTIYFATGDGNHTAYTRDTWVQLWILNLSGAGNLDSPLIFSGKLYYGGNSKVYCLNASTGVSIWTNTTGARASSLAGAGTMVYVGTSGKMQAINASTGVDVWKSGSTRHTVAGIAGGNVYAISAQNKKGLRVYNMTSGVEVWSNTISLDAYYRDNGPSVGAGLVVCPGNGTKKITAYRPGAGKPYLVE